MTRPAPTPPPLATARGTGERDAANDRARQSQQHGLSKSHKKQRHDLRAAECEGIGQLRLAAKVGVGDDANSAGREKEAGKVADDTDEKCEEEVLLGSTRELHINGEGDGEPQCDDTDLHEQHEMTAENREGPVQDLADIHRLQVGHVASTSVSGMAVR
jgi:hypothetical protein